MFYHICYCITYICITTMVIRSGISIIITLLPKFLIIIYSTVLLFVQISKTKKLYIFSVNKVQSSMLLLTIFMTITYYFLLIWTIMTIFALRFTEIENRNFYSLIDSLLWLVDDFDPYLHLHWNSNNKVFFNNDVFLRMSLKAIEIIFTFLTVFNIHILYTRICVTDRCYV